MQTNAMKEKFDVVELFDQYALFSNFRIDRGTVPAGWHCYDIRGSDSDFGALAFLEPHVLVNHAGSILSPQPFPFPDGQDYLDIREEIGFTEHSNVTLAQFCGLFKLEAPSPQTKYAIRPASPDEAGLFYAMPPEKDAEMGCIGHVRIDFGRGGDGFYHTWHPRGPEEWNTQDFKDELTEVVDELRENVLKNFSAMTGYCRDHGGEISGGWVQNYGYVVETDRYSYLLRCNPLKGDYQAYLTCFDRQIQQMGQGQDKELETEQTPDQSMTMGGM